MRRRGNITSKFKCWPQANCMRRTLVGVEPPSNMKRGIHCYSSSRPTSFVASSCSPSTRPGWCSATLQHKQAKARNDLRGGARIAHWSICSCPRLPRRNPPATLPGQAGALNQCSCKYRRVNFCAAFGDHRGTAAASAESRAPRLPASTRALPPRAGRGEPALRASRGRPADAAVVDKGLRFPRQTSSTSRPAEQPSG